MDVALGVVKAKVQLGLMCIHRRSISSPRSAELSGTGEADYSEEGSRRFQTPYSDGTFGCIGFSGTEVDLVAMTNYEAMLFEGKAQGNVLHEHPHC